MATISVNLKDEVVVEDDKPLLHTNVAPVSDEDINAALRPKSKYAPLEGVDNSIELLSMFDPQISETGEVIPHKWQYETSEFLCAGRYTKALPLKYVLCACNGSGKDAYVIAPFAVWFAITKIRSRCIITSSSFTQLHSQTEAYIKDLCLKINETLGRKVFLIKQMHIVCVDTGSEIKMFVTDEGGRAEGYHPFPDYQAGELVVIMNECKSVAPIIYKHLFKCTYTHWIEVSSPGQSSGDFYNHFTRATLFPEAYVNGKWYARRVSYLDCPHIPASRVVEELLDCDGEDDPWFKNTRKAEFTTLGEEVVLTSEAIDKCVKFSPKRISSLGKGKRFGLDLAAGGDECCLTYAIDNEIIEQRSWRARATEVTVKLVIDLLEEFGCDPKEANERIRADHGGMGASFAGHFRDKGWQFIWINNQNVAKKSHLYMNRGAEMWWNVKKLVERNLILFSPKVLTDTKLRYQLSNRYYDMTSGRIKLESKEVARANGHPSPDRADSLVLCLGDLHYNDFPAEGVKSSAPVKSTVPTTDKIIAIMDKRKYAYFDNPRSSRPQRRGLLAAYRQGYQ